MNRSAAFWVRAAISNLRALLLIGVLLAAVIANIANKNKPNWEGLSTILGVAALFIALSVWRTFSTVKKTATLVNAACDRMTLDAQGIATANAIGATTFTPWSKYHRWKEGKLVFTIGDAKAFRTVPKSALNESQIAELRGLLQSQIRV